MGAAHNQPPRFETIDLTRHVAPSNLLLIFDLDGTLIDSSEDLAISVNAALAHVGRTSLSNAIIHSYVGNGAPTLIRRALGAATAKAHKPLDAASNKRGTAADLAASSESVVRGSSEETEAEALAFFLKFYRKHALEHTRLYDGIRETLDDAREAGQRMAVLTNKPVKISTDIVGALGLADHFFRVYGGDSFLEKKPDPIGINQLCAESGFAKAQTVMIGDSSVDVQTARNAGVKSCGVLWGFQPEGFTAEPPDILARAAEDLRELWQAIRV